MNYLNSPKDPKNKTKFTHHDDWIEVFDPKTTYIYDVLCMGCRVEEFKEEFTIEVDDGHPLYMIKDDMIIFKLTNNPHKIRVFNKNIIGELVITFKKVKGEKSK